MWSVTKGIKLSASDEKKLKAMRPRTVKEIKHCVGINIRNSIKFASTLKHGFSPKAETYSTLGRCVTSDKFACTHQLVASMCNS
jgi:hypothetical protein